MKKVSINILKEDATHYVGREIKEFTYKTGEVGKRDFNFGKLYLGVINLQACICQEDNLDTIELSKVTDITFID